MHEVSTARFTRLLLIDLLSEHEPQTGEDLLRRLSAVLHSQSVPLAHCRVRSASDMEVLLKQIGRNSSVDDIPLIHLECHGSNEGIRLTDGGVLEWGGLADLLRYVNYATGLNLAVTMSCCLGAEIHYQQDIQRFAVYWGALGPKCEVDHDDLLEVFTQFYRGLFEGLDVAILIKQINANSRGRNRFVFVSADLAFNLAVDHYKKTFSSKTAIEKRCRRLARKLARSGHVASKERIKKSLPTVEQDSLSRIRSHYFGFDVYPENVERFGRDVEPYFDR